jgi:hypothetical protein
VPAERNSADETRGHWYRFARETDALDACRGHFAGRSLVPRGLRVIPQHAEQLCEVSLNDGLGRR